MAFGIRKLRILIYLLAIPVFILLAMASLFYIVTESKIANTTDFTALGAISNTITAIIGLLLLAVTFFYLLATKDMVYEMKKQTALAGEPVVSIKAVPSPDSHNILNLNLTNTGGSAAYDVSVEFDPDIPYEDGITLNQLNMFHRLALLDKGESIELFLDSAPEYFKSNKPKRTKATVEYYTTPLYQREPNPEPRTRIIEIDFEERKKQMQIRNMTMNDLVKEIEELKQGLLLIARDIENDKRNKND